jgi:DNA repair exonuclease SbcCD ATPase subunit
MRICKEYGDDQINLLGSSKSQTFKNLSYSQAIALFALPAEEREDFVKDNDVENMSARQLQDAIKAKEQAEKEAEDARAETEKAQNQADGQKKLYENANSARQEAEKKLQEETERFKKELAEAAKPAETSKDELKKLRADIRAKVEKDFKSQIDQLSIEKKTAEEKASEIEKKYQSELKKLKLDNESISAKQQEAEKKFSLTAPEAQKFSVYITSFQDNFKNMLDAVQSLADSGNTETADRLRGALSRVIANMADNLKS